MEKKLGGVLGILAAAAVIFAGAARGVPMVFGKLGAALMREAAGSSETKDETDKRG